MLTDIQSHTKLVFVVRLDFMRGVISEGSNFMEDLGPLQRQNTL